jgi:hypothetical protein
MVPMIGDDGAPPTEIGPRAEVTLTGLLLMWENEQPVLLRLGGVPGDCIPIFTCKDTLTRAATEFALAYGSIKQVYDGKQFLADMLAQNVRIIVDPRIGPNGKVRYIDVRPLPPTA